VLLLSGKASEASFISSGVHNCSSVQKRSRAVIEFRFKTYVRKRSFPKWATSLDLVHGYRPITATGSIPIIDFEFRMRECILTSLKEQEIAIN
jgi:hypothetical protein